MMVADVEEWLADQVRDQLAEGAIGLYEFLWWLDSSRFDLPATVVREVARGLAGQLVRDGLAGLYRIAWPSYLVLAGPLPVSVLAQDDAWDEGLEFVALVGQASDPP